MIVYANSLTIPLRTVSESNRAGEHWAQKAKRHKEQKKVVSLCLLALPHPDLPCKIHLTRVGKKLLDDDNLPPSLKYVRDAIAEWIIPNLPIGKADDSTQLKWFYYQEKGKNYAVNIKFEFNS